MTSCLLIVTDGRPGFLDRAEGQAFEFLPPFDHKVVIDDSAHELGFDGAIRQGWAEALATGADYVFHLEDDFTFIRPVPVDRMIRVLRSHPHLVQMALLRQPWNEREKAAGGIVQQHPQSYTQKTEGKDAWLEHCRFVTTNPAVWPRWVLEAGWPQGPQSEGRFGLTIFASDPHLRSAFWGRGEEWCQHVGSQRVGVGY